jgi:hypothetical protein
MRFCVYGITKRRVERRLLTQLHQVSFESRYSLDAKCRARRCQLTECRMRVVANTYQARGRHTPCHCPRGETRPTYSVTSVRYSHRSRHQQRKRHLSNSPSSERRDPLSSAEKRQTRGLTTLWRVYLRICFAHLTLTSQQSWSTADSN